VPESDIERPSADCSAAFANPIGLFNERDRAAAEEEGKKSWRALQTLGLFCICAAYAVVGTGG
jgi:hypothetical protein